MGEEEALLPSLHFLELMTSLRAAGTVPLTPSGSSRAGLGPAGMWGGGAGGKGCSGGGNKRTPLTCLQVPTVALTKSQSFIHSSNIIVFYKWGERNAFHSFIQRSLKIISPCKTARCNKLYIRREMHLFVYSFFRYLPASP